MIGQQLFTVSSEGVMASSLATGPTEEPWEDLHPPIDRDTERRTGVTATTLIGLNEPSRSVTYAPSRPGPRNAPGSRAKCTTS